MANTQTNRITIIFKLVRQKWHKEEAKRLWGWELKVPTVRKVEWGFPTGIQHSDGIGLVGGGPVPLQRCLQVAGQAWGYLNKHKALIQPFCFTHTQKNQQYSLSASKKQQQQYSLSASPPEQTQMHQYSLSASPQTCINVFVNKHTIPPFTLSLSRRRSFLCENQTQGKLSRTTEQWCSQAGPGWPTDRLWIKTVVWASPPRPTPPPQYTYNQSTSHFTVVSERRANSPTDATKKLRPMCVKDAHVKKIPQQCRNTEIPPASGNNQVGQQDSDAAGFAKEQKTVTLNSTAHEQGVKDKTERGLTTTKDRPLATAKDRQKEDSGMTHHYQRQKDDSPLIKTDRKMTHLLKTDRKMTHRY